MTSTILNSSVDKYSLSISDIALEQVKKQLTKRSTPNAYLRLGLKGGACQGYKLVLQYEDELKHKDLIFTFDSIKVIVDPKSIVYLTGTEIHWTQELMKHGFDIRVPNQKSSCGCGQSIDF